MLACLKCSKLAVLHVYEGENGTLYTGVSFCSPECAAKWLGSHDTAVRWADRGRI
jgi:hypothetical protein